MDENEDLFSFFRVLFYDVILALIYIASDAYLIYFYLSQVISR